MEGSDTLAVFCQRLAALHRQSGSPSIASLSRHSRVALSRSQIYAILAGQIRKPPSWEFVQQFVAACHQSATRGGRSLSITTDPAAWRHDHHALIEAYARRPINAPNASRHPAGRTLSPQQVHLFEVKNASIPTPKQIGIVTGDLREVRIADVWVNSENTDMRMARINDFSVSAIIRYGGARKDMSGRVIEDTVFDDLERTVGSSRPVAPATAIATTSGQLRHTNGVQRIVHVAAVHGEPGSGFRPIQEIGRCVPSALIVVEDLPISDVDSVTVLFPLLATGTGNGSLQDLAPSLLRGALDYLTGDRVTKVGKILFLAYTEAEKVVTLRALSRDPRLAKVAP